MTDHPRSRGVYEAFFSVGAACGGSSPLARGLRERGDDGERATRIIPARAGFTAIYDRNDPHTGDHPRSRGVYVLWG